MPETAKPNLRDEEGLEFEAQPDLFVLLEQSPIVWTVRGIRHFAPRFRRVGVDIGNVATREQFQVAVRRWDKQELRDLILDIEECAVQRQDSLAYQCLQSILEGRPDTEALIQELEFESQQATGAEEP